MPKGPAARILDPVVHPLPGVLTPGPGSPNVLIGGKPAWRGVPAGAAAAITSAKATSDAAITTAEAATVAAAGTPGLPAAKAAEETTKATAAASMGSLITSTAGGADIHACTTPLPIPPHGPGVVIDGSPTVLINGLPACRQGDTIIEAVGPPDKILMGLPTVIIGDVGGAAVGGADMALPAPPPAGPGGGGSPGADANPNLALAMSLVTPGGSGTADDAKLVAKELAKLPKSVLEQMKKNGTKVVACRGSVTDYRTDLKGTQPRGWPPGSTWDNVPGANMRDKNEVVIAVIGHGTPAGPHVPKTGEGQGSANMVAHEATHSIDRGDPSPSSSADFTKARDADMGKLSDYEKQAGEGGPRETYAESAARHAEGKDGDTPNLKKYWDAQK